MKLFVFVTLLAFACASRQKETTLPMGSHQVTDLTVTDVSAGQKQVLRGQPNLVRVEFLGQSFLFEAAGLKNSRNRAVATNTYTLVKAGNMQGQLVLEGSFESPRAHISMTKSGSELLSLTSSGSGHVAVVSGSLESEAHFTQVQSLNKEKCLVENYHWIADGWCDTDGNYNTEACNFDGGDCCEEDCVDSTYTCGVDGFDCVGQACLVDSPHWIGDAWCDQYGNYNTAACGYDGGDCCEETCTPVDGGYDCTQPFDCKTCIIDHAHWIADGWCDTYGNYNTEQCGYDGGDCCADSCTPSTYSCVASFDCQDPYYAAKSFAFVRGGSALPAIALCVVAAGVVGALWTRRSKKQALAFQDATAEL